MAEEEAGVQPSNNHYWDPATQDHRDPGDDDWRQPGMVIENDDGGVDDDAIRHGHDQGQGGGGQPARTYTHVLAPF